MKGQFGEPWVATNYDSSIVNSESRYVTCAPNDDTMRRIVAAVNALDGYDPAKLGDFLDACELLWSRQGMALGMPSRAEFKQWCAAYDALTGEGE